MEKESENSLEDGNKSKSTASDWWDFIYNNTAQIANLIQFGEKGDPYSLKADFEGSKKLFDSYSKRLKNNFGETSSDPSNESDNLSNERTSYKGTKRAVDTTLYDRLGVSPTASKAEIKSSYRKMALKYHPDKNTTQEAKKKFQEIGEAYQVLVDDLSRQNYDKNGMTTSMGFQEFDIDPSVFFIMLFGCDLLEEFIGPLKLESLLKYDVNLADLAKSNQFTSYEFKFNTNKSTNNTEIAVHRDSVHNYMNTVQNYREARLAVLLRDRIDSFIEIKRIPEEFLEFIESACKETYVDLLVTSVGWVYENCAESYISETTSFLGLGATYSNLQSFGRNINNGYNIVKSTFSAFNLFYQNQIKDKNSLENLGDTSNGGMMNMGMTNEKMTQQIEAVLECFLTIVVFDVESTVKQACIKVCNDEDVDQKSRLRRAHVMKRIGMKMQSIAERVRNEQGKSKIDVSKIVEQAYIKARQKADQVH